MSRAPLLRKFGKLSVREILALAYNLPSVQTKRIRSHPDWRGIHVCCIFFARKHAMRWGNSHFSWPGKSHGHVVVNWQLSKQDIHWPVSQDRITGLDVDPLGLCFFKLSKLSLIKTITNLHKFKTALFCCQLQWSPNYYCKN